MKEMQRIRLRELGSTRVSLDVLASTLELIPDAEASCFIGGEVWYYANESILKMSLDNYVHTSLCDGSYREAAFYYFSDGTCAIYIDPRNTRTSCYSDFDAGFNPAIANTYLFQGKLVVKRGHTHTNSCDPSSTDKSSIMNAIPRVIYYNGNFCDY